MPGYLPCTYCQYLNFNHSASKQGILKIYIGATVLDTESPRTTSFLRVSHRGRISMCLPFSSTLLCFWLLTEKNTRLDGPLFRTCTVMYFADLCPKIKLHCSLFTYMNAVKHIFESSYIATTLSARKKTLITSK